MDDEEGGPKRLQCAIQQLKSMTEEERHRYLAHCRFELRYDDGWSSEHYQNYIEAAKHV